MSHSQWNYFVSWPTSQKWLELRTVAIQVTEKHNQEFDESWKFGGWSFGFLLLVHANTGEIHWIASAEAAFAVQGKLTMALHFGCVHLHWEEQSLFSQLGKHHLVVRLAFTLRPAFRSTFTFVDIVEI